MGTTYTKNGHVRQDGKPLWQPKSEESKKALEEVLKIDARERAQRASRGMTPEQKKALEAQYIAEAIGQTNDNTDDSQFVDVNFRARVSE